MRFNGHLYIQVYLIRCAIFSSSHYIHHPLLPVRQCRQYKSSALTAVSGSRSSLHLSSSSSTDNEVPNFILRSWRLRKSDPKVLLKYSHYKGPFTYYVSSYNKAGSVKMLTNADLRDQGFIEKLMSYENP